MMSGAASRLLSALAACALTACASLSPENAVHPHFLSGSDAADLVARDVGRVLATYQPALHIDRAQCPFLINLTDPHARGHCTLPVERVAMRVDVAGDSALGGRFFFERTHPIDAVVVTRVAERDLAAELHRSYAGTFTVRCDGDAVRTVAVRDTVACTATGPDGLRKPFLARPRGDGGSLTAGARPLPSGDTLEEQFLGRDAVDRKTGGIVLDGSRVARYLTASAGGSEREDLVRRGLLGSAHCPRSIVLHATANVVCTVAVGDKRLPYKVRFDEGRGLVIASDADAYATATLGILATRYFSYLHDADGRRHHAAVDCGPSRVALISPGSSVTCTSHEENTKLPVAISLTTRDGTLSFDYADD